jgi:LPXTG-motif cell wall-anchored protein
MRTRRLVVPALATLMVLVSSSAVLAQQAVTVPIGPGRDEPTGTGTATLTAQGNQTIVVIRAAATNPEMLAHIHADACPGVGAVVFPLTNPVNGTSTTVIDAPLSQVLAQGKSINLHKSPSDSGVYVGCGNLAAAQAGGAGGAAQVPARLPATGDLGQAVPVLVVLGAGLVGAGATLRRRRP